MFFLISLNRLTTNTQLPTRTGLLILACLMLPALSHAKVLWRGDFETGDISQWHTSINGAGLSVINHCSAAGKFAGKVHITGDAEFLWKNNKQLNRSEFHHRMPEGFTYEGKHTYFSFSFYLPKAFSNYKHELGYWESDKTWQQMFRFNITGTELSFQQSSAQDAFWKIKKGAAPGQWHQISMHIHWSIEKTLGSTQVWVNGKDMGKQFFQTLPDKSVLMFTQIGVLRTQEDSTEEIFIDNAQEVDNLDELLASASPKNDCHQSLE